MADAMSANGSGRSTSLPLAQSPIDALTASISALNPTTPDGAQAAAAKAAAAALPARSAIEPKIRIILREGQVEQSLRQGMKEMCMHAVRKHTLEWVDEGEEPKPPNHTGPEEYWWFVRIARDADLPPLHLSITPSHTDYTDLTSHLPSSRLPASHFSIYIRYQRTCEAFRGLGHVLAFTRHCTVLVGSDPPDPGGGGAPQAKYEWSGDTGGLQWDEDCLFKSLGTMVDCSRNGVLLVERVKDLCRYLALMGQNYLQLYTEDTYKIESEPFFGYFRGGYTQAELKEIDDYADALGVEIIPCIQTLGHLGQMLQWPQYGALRDTHEVLLARSEDTYKFIEKMITTITCPLRSKRIHIGMDEAHGVSDGRFRQIFGYQDSTQVFMDHLRRVTDICRRLNLKPMIWSDMLFCLAAKNNSLGGYYDSANPATPELVDAIPDDVDLVYWDYYHTNPVSYTKKLREHVSLGRKPPWMASGIWSWSRFWTALPFTFETIRASSQAAKDPNSGVERMMTTVWGDEGAESDCWSALPGLLYFAEHAYTPNPEVNVALLKRKHDACFGGDFDSFVYASKLDDLQPENQPTDLKSHFTPNMSKWLLWEEPFYSILSPQYAGYDFETHFGSLHMFLEMATTTDPSPLNPSLPPQEMEDMPLNARLMLPKLLAQVLSLKCHLRDRLAYSYRNSDWEELQALAGPASNSRMHRLRALVDELWKYHRKLWMSMYKPFGWEILELRYGGLRARLETMHTRLIAFLDSNDGSVTRVEELEVQTEIAWPGTGSNLMLDYHRVSRPTYV